MTPIINYKDLQPITIQLFPNLEQDPEGDPENHVMWGLDLTDTQ